MTPGPRQALTGLLRVARGKADGFERFGATPQAFVASLLPLAAFPLVGSAWLLQRGQAGDAALSLLASLITLLAPPVLSHALARAWGREAAWPRYAVAFNWSQWAIPLAAMALLLTMRLLAGIGLPAVTAGNAFVLGLAGYVLWLHWFVVRHCLALPGWQALAFSLLVSLGTLVLVALPQLLAGGGPA